MNYLVKIDLFISLCNDDDNEVKQLALLKQKQKFLGITMLAMIMWCPCFDAEFNVIKLYGNLA